MNTLGLMSLISNSLFPFWIDMVGRRNHLKLLFMKKLLKDNAYRRLGYYGGVQAVFLHVPGNERTEITSEVIKLEPKPNTGSFFTSAAFYFHPLGLPEDATVEVHGTSLAGHDYRFVFLGDSQLHVPLHDNYRPFERKFPFEQKSLISAQARFLGEKADITDLCRIWTVCDCALEDVLPYIARDLFKENDEMSTAALNSGDEDRIEVHAMYSDLSSERLETKLKID